jgi:hypothetical protein
MQQQAGWGDPSRLTGQVACRASLGQAAEVVAAAVEAHERMKCLYRVCAHSNQLLSPDWH